MASRAPSIVVLGGPNGAGKSTAAPGLLRDALAVKEFVNAGSAIAGNCSTARCPSHPGW